jgi:putative ABC transport system permease protein
VYAARSLRKTPFFTAVVIATLAIAIGANTAVFSILDGVLFKPLPYADPQSLVTVYGTDEALRHMSLSYPNFADLRAQNQDFADIAATTGDRSTMTGHGQPRSLRGQQVSFSYFAVFGLNPQIGRFFAAPDAQLGSAHALVLSYAVYASIFGADPKIIGSSVQLDGAPYRIVGVAPAAFRPPARRGGYETSADYWTVIRPSHATGEDQRGSDYLSVFARLRSGVSIEAAKAGVQTVMARLARRYVSTNKHSGVDVVALEETVLGPVRPLLFGVFAAAAAVLLVACANVANLLLSRAATRERELAVRYAIGASRARIIAQILTETLLFATVGGILGIALAASALHQFIALNPPGIPRLETIAIDGSAALFTFAAVAFCTLAAGLIPALALSRIQLGDTLKAAGRGGDHTRGARARAAFAIAEIAITLALVVASGLVVRSFVALTHTPLGFEPNDVLTVQVASLPPQRYATDPLLIAFERRAVEREAAIPGATDAAWSLLAPFSGADFQISFTIANKPTSPGDEQHAAFNIVSAGYFGVLRIPLVRGRLFNGDDRVGTTPVVIVNEAFAHEFYGKVSPIGKRLKPGIRAGEGSPPFRTIVGVAADARNTYAAPPQPEIYLPNSQIALLSFGTLLVRAQPGIDHHAIAAAIPALDPEIAAADVRPLTDNLATDAAHTRVSAIALGTLAAIALFLASAGIYAVVSYGVAQRTHEFGIRKALGARDSHVLSDVLARAARLAALGILSGLILAAFAARLVAAQLYGVGLVDPLTYTAVVVILFAATLAAALIPALRAMRVDPIVALRYE